MMVSSRGRYALRVLLDLAQHREDGYVPMHVIAQRQGISKKYMEQIMPALTKGGLVDSVQGKRGGYRLNRPPQEYSVGEILRLTEGGLAPVACLDHEPLECPRAAECATLPLWQGLSRVISEYLDSVTLQDLLDGQQSRAGNEYMI